MTTLGDICKFAFGAAFPIHLQGRRSGAVPFFKVSDMNALGNEEVLTVSANYVDAATARSIGAHVWPEGTIVFPKVGGALLTNKKRVLGVAAAFDNNIMGILPSSSEVVGEWLRLWFEGVDLASLANTQALPSIRQSAVAKLVLNIPSVPAQQSAVQVAKLQLALTKEAASACEAQLSDARSLVSALFVECFGQSTPIGVGLESSICQPGWDWQPLQSVARLESGHTPSRRHPEWWGGDVPWLALPDIRKLHGKIAHDTGEHTNDLGLANSSARLLPVNTVCVCRDASIGFVTMLGRPMATSQHFCNWVCDPEKLDPEFLMYAFMASFDYLRELGSGSVLKTIYMQTIESFHVCAPNIDEQRRIAQRLRARLAEVEALQVRLQERLAEIERLPQRILAAAFDGLG